MAVLSISRRSIVRVAVAGGLLVWAASTVVGADRPALAVGCAVVATVGLFRPRYPVVALGCVLAGLLVAAQFAGFDGPDDPFIAALVWASYGVGRHAPLQRQPWAAAFTLFFISLNLLAHRGAFPSLLVFPTLYSAAPWLAGLWIRRFEERSNAALQTAQDVTQEHSSALRRATAEERLRLARELHDVAAHHMTTVSLLSQVLRERSERGQALSSADLATIERSAQAALGEIRRVVGVLRSPGEHPDLAPLPSLDELPALIHVSREAGQPVSLVVDGAPRPLPEGISLTLYRIAQETLSNARRHGRPPATALSLTWGQDHVTLRSENAMTPLARRFVAGNGILGMRERVELYGGRLDAGPNEAGIWTVEATLPVPQ